MIYKYLSTTKRIAFIKHECVSILDKYVLQGLEIKTRRFLWYKWEVKKWNDINHVYHSSIIEVVKEPERRYDVMVNFLLDQEKNKAEKTILSDRETPFFNYRIYA